MSKKVIIKFDNEEAAMHFAVWLCESGEQLYWDWMEYREGEEDGPITATSFDYFKNNNNQFGTKIKAKCGRLDD